MDNARAVVGIVAQLWNRNGHNLEVEQHTTLRLPLHRCHVHAHDHADDRAIGRDKEHGVFRARVGGLAQTQSVLQVIESDETLDKELL